ncbi:alpha/beta hydrolase [Actinomadura spongiicola]|uniref:Alpha/beta hydrolase n=1 Tax=Actinomadura spongiicola TaxID=2303421 RepID=A0A372GQI3_9ACTN|nr:alpha/beta hydrolase [Actinomadura spongiicola]RFS87359.1 alpha/beta hydrolase [Actinomadura spongiicola]
MTPSENATPFSDYGGDGPIVVAVHGHFGSARTFAGLAEALAGSVRLIALDQRGHGHARKGVEYACSDYVDDVAAFLEARELAPAIVLGHSMGGVVAYTLAARRPELVRALIVEEGQALVDANTLDTRGWPKRAPSLRALGEAIEAQGMPDASYFLQSAVRYPDGWGLTFDPEEMLRSQELLVGDHWADWSAVKQPTLLLHGTESFVLPTEQAREMARRPGTRYREFSGCGHWIHDDDPAGVAEAIGNWVRDIENDAPGSGAVEVNS